MSWYKSDVVGWQLRKVGRRVEDVKIPPTVTNGDSAFVGMRRLRGRQWKGRQYAIVERECQCATLATRVSSMQARTKIAELTVVPSTFSLESWSAEGPVSLDSVLCRFVACCSPLKVSPGRFCAPLSVVPIKATRSVVKVGCMRPCEIPKGGISGDSENRCGSRGSSQRNNMQSESLNRSRYSARLLTARR